MHFLSNNVIKNGSDREAYASFDDEPKAGTKPEPMQVKKAETAKPPKEKKKKFNWGKLAGNVLAGLAVVAVVAIAAVAIAVTLGAATAVIGAIAIGAAVAGTAAVASQAISDVKSGEVSNKSAYMIAGGREAFVGAISGAIFGPFGATKALGGKMLLGGVTNGFESVIRQTLEGKGINFKTILVDAGIGAAARLLFHGAGKLFQKSSPFVKKAFNKVSTEISDNMKAVKIAFNNMEMPKGVRLACGLGGGDSKVAKEFLEQFKKAKGDITERITKADRIKQFNLQNSRMTMQNDLNKFRKDLIKDGNARDISKICSTMDVENPSLKGVAGSGNWNHNPTIIDHRGIDPREFCKTAQDYIKYHRALLSNEYIDSLPDSFFIGKDKLLIKEDMTKLRASIERVKKEAESLSLNKHGEPSFEYKWNIDNCAEIWSARDAILKGARYDNLIIRTENLSGGFAEPCDNCIRTFLGFYNID